MNILRSIERFSTLRNLVVAIVTSFVVVMVMAFLTQTLVYDVYGDVTMPDTRFTYSINEMTEVFNTLGQEGLYVWAQAHILDFLFPLTYMLAMAFGINMELRKSFPDSANAKKLILFPLLAGVTDYIENILVLTQIAAYPSLSEPVILISSAITSLKWILLGVGFVIIFGLVPLIIYYKLSSSERTQHQ